MSFSQPVSSFDLIRTCAPTMSSLGCAAETFLVLATRNNLLGPVYDRDVTMHPNEDLGHCYPCHAPVVATAFSVFKYLERYAACFDIGHSRSMRADWNQLQMSGGLGERCGTPAPEQARRWNHLDIGGALSRH